MERLRLVGLWAPSCVWNGCLWQEGAPSDANPSKAGVSITRRLLHSPEVAAAPLAVLVLGPAGAGTAHGGDSGGSKRDADEATLLKQGRVVVGPRALQDGGGHRGMSQP